VGGFGGVQVTDWGLAKGLPETPAADEPTHRAEEETAAYVTQIETPMAADSATRTGAMLGTPHYIPPEQAGGEIRKLDARSDVFDLGAILCNILTGQPPYRGGERNAGRVMALREQLQDPFAR